MSPIKRGRLSSNNGWYAAALNNAPLPALTGVAAVGLADMGCLTIESGVTAQPLIESSKLTHKNRYFVIAIKPLLHL